MSIPVITAWDGDHNATTYAEVVEYVYMYLELADDAIPGDNPDVYLYEGILGGFQVDVWPIQILPSWEEAPVEQWIGTDNMYVTVRDAQRLEAAGLAKYAGRCASMDAAIARLADNAIPRGPGYAMVEEHWSRIATYEEARAYMASCQGEVDLIPTYPGTYEVYGNSATGLQCGENGYIYAEDAERLAAEYSNIHIIHLA